MALLKKADLRKQSKADFTVGEINFSLKLIGNIYFPNRKISLAVFLVCTDLFYNLLPIRYFLQDTVLLFCLGGP